MKRIKLVVLIAVLAAVVIFVPILPAANPCPNGHSCPNPGSATRQYGSFAYVLIGFGASGAYPVSDFHNDSGHYVWVDNYFEGNYGLSACNKGELWAALYGGPWGCDILVNFYWNL